jgi:hypothetical protein
MHRPLVLLGIFGVPLAFMGMSVVRANVHNNQTKTPTALPLIVTTWSAECFQLSTSTGRIVQKQRNNNNIPTQHGTHFE